QAGGFDVVIPESLMGLEPLQAIYSKNCISRIEDKLSQGCFRIISFFEEVEVKEISKKKVSEFDPNFLSFYNINTIKDFKKAKEIYAKSRRSDGN
ncbi:MAG: hypothetical protein Q8M92_06595, partial [Candidatus Subteraquimicrobiales bacterium]|nr:hypothetical protein [Candidatus Subteraquimicrobiales bacterium]